MQWVLFPTATGWNLCQVELCWRLHHTVVVVVVGVAMDDDCKKRIKLSNSTRRKHKSALNPLKCTSQVQVEYAKITHSWHKLARIRRKRLKVVVRNRDTGWDYITRKKKLSQGRVFFHRAHFY